MEEKSFLAARSRGSRDRGRQLTRDRHDKAFDVLGSRLRPLRSACCCRVSAVGDGRSA